MRFRLASVLLFAGLLASAPQDPLGDAVAALQSGDTAAAERILRAESSRRPKDPEVLTVLAVTLDQEKKYSAADEFYKRALALTPHEPALLNNYGNHLIAQGKWGEAKPLFLQALAAEPSSVNSRVQLARIALQERAVARALKYLEGLSKLDADQSFSLGVALSAAGQYAKAEEFFSLSLEQNPADFQTIYDLGLAASHAGHAERARAMLNQALQLRPENADVMYDLAAADLQLRQNAQALELLVKASKLAPQRADILQLLARTSAELGYFPDAIEQWRSYLRLNPFDEAAKREIAFDQTAIGDQTDAALSELRLFVQRHPNDAAGHYELGTAIAAAHPEEAVKELTRAISLKEDFYPARVARGLLLYKQNRPKEALPDFQLAAQHEADNPIVLERLGQTYMALDDVAKAVPVLRKAAEGGPGNSAVLLQYGRALEKSGRTREAAEVFARCRELGPAKSQLPHPPGLVDFLSLSPDEQYARYRTGVESTLRKNPLNAEAQARYVDILLDAGDSANAAVAARKLWDLHPSQSLLAEAGDALIAAQQYAAVLGLLQASNALPASLALDRAIATLHVDDAKSAMALMNAIPEPDRGGDYYLALGLVLEGAGQQSEAKTAFEQALRLRPKRAALYREAALVLIHDAQTGEATRLVDRAAAEFPEDQEIQSLHLNSH